MRDRDGSTMNEIKISEHFSLNEFQCRHCGLVMIHPPLIELLEAIRRAKGGPLIITSGYRCKAHNASVGGAKNSYHTKGRAADISAQSISERRLIIEAARANGAIEVIDGTTKGYVHIAI